MLSTPRIGGRLTAVAVDSTDPRRIFLGTEEGTVLKSMDLGVTWQEYETDPVVTESDAFTLIPPGLPELGATNKSPLTIFWDPPGAVYLDRVFVTGVQLVQFSAFPADLVVGFVPVGTGVPQELLGLVSRSSRGETEPIRQIALCPGGVYSVLAAGRYDLFGSQDDGLTYVRIFGAPGVELSSVGCSSSDPRLVYVGTTYGLYRSTDGGQIFDMMMLGWPGAPATAVTVRGATGEDPASTLFAAWGSGVWAGDPDSERGLSMLYPDFGNSNTAPWSDVRWIDVSRDGDIWMGTDEGIRASLDRGKTWAAVARDLFERNSIRQVAVGPSDSGAERVAVMMRDWVYSSDDRGQTWFPFLHGVSRRSFKQMAVSPQAAGLRAGWWVVTTGELWTTVAPQELGRQPEVDEMRGWARRRLSRTPPMGTVIERVLDRNYLSGREIDKLVSRSRKRHLIPILSMSMIVNKRPFREFNLSGPTPVLENTGQSDFNWNFYIQGFWSLENTSLVSEQLAGFQGQITNLRNELMYAIEDVWHERVNLLRRVVAGEADATQATVLQTRILALEAILETWMRRPLAEDRRDES